MTAWVCPRLDKGVCCTSDRPMALPALPGLPPDRPRDRLLHARRRVPALPDGDGAGRPLPRRAGAAAAAAAADPGEAAARAPRRRAGAEHLLPCGAMPLARRLLLLVLACAALAVAGCGSDSEDAGLRRRPRPTSTPAGRPSPRSRCPKGKAPEEARGQGPQGGHGAAAEAGKQRHGPVRRRLGVNGRQFDASWDRGEPFAFQLGAGAGHPGLGPGRRGHEGRRPPAARDPARPRLRRRRARRPTIGPNETLVFVIDLLGVE